MKTQNKTILRHIYIRPPIDYKLAQKPLALYIIVDILHASEATVSGGNDFAKAIQAKNLKKVDPEEERKRREQSQQSRSELAFSSLSTLLHHS